MGPLIWGGVDHLVLGLGRLALVDKGHAALARRHLRSHLQVALDPGLAATTFLRPDVASLVWKEPTQRVLALAGLALVSKGHATLARRSFRLLFLASPPFRLATTFLSLRLSATNKDHTPGADGFRAFSFLFADGLFFRNGRSDGISAVRWFHGPLHLSFTNAVARWMTTQYTADQIISILSKQPLLDEALAEFALCGAALIHRQLDLDSTLTCHPSCALLIAGHHGEIYRRLAFDFTLYAPTFTADPCYKQRLNVKIGGSGTNAHLYLPPLYLLLQSATY